VAIALYADPSLWRAVFSWGFLAAAAGLCLTASSNYVLNELIDAPRDRLHPTKHTRPAAAGLISRDIAIAEWLLLGAAGIGLGFAANSGSGLTLAALWGMGVLYNVPPIRLKDRPYVDVLSESVNNPLRFMLGWHATGIAAVAPVSALLSYWMLGAFLMAIKRFAEYRSIDDPAVAAAYRSSFRHYDTERLLISVMFYATAFGLFGGMFIVRYRIELAVAIPLVAGFMAAYLHIGFMPASPAVNPERLYRHGAFFIYTALTFFVMLALLYIDIPALPEFVHPTIPTAPAPFD